MKKFTVLFIICFVVILTSCKSILTKIITTRSIVNNAYYLQKNDQKVIFLPMVHLSKARNFEEVKKFIAEKRQLGYTVYYEKVTYDKDSANFYEVSLKMRKLTGLTFGQTYLSDEQKEFKENSNKKKYVWQSSIDYGLDYKVDIHADYTLSSLIKAYEDKHGTVKLQECDYDTPLNTEYKCSTPIKYREVVHDLRNAKLMRHILLDTVNNKKLIVYGLGHYYASTGVYLNLFHYNQYKEIKARNWKD